MHGANMKIRNCKV